MLRSLFFSLLMIATTSAAWAQFDVVDTAWDRLLSSPTYSGLHPVEVEAAPDGGVLVVGLARQTPLDNFMRPADVVLVKLNENGDMEWTDTLASPPMQNGSQTGGRYADAAIDDQGNTFVVVSRVGASFLRCYGPSGAVAWETNLPLGTLPGSSGWSQYNAACVEVAPSGDVVVCGLTMKGAYPRADVRAFGPDGTPRWEWRGELTSGASSSVQAYPTGLAIGPNGTVYAYGQTDTPSYQHTSQIIALDANGQFLWNGQPTLPGVVVSEVDFDSQGQIVAVSLNGFGVSITKFQTDGVEVFSSSHNESGYLLSGTTIAVDAFDRIAVGGWRRPVLFGARDATLFRFDPAGTYLGRTVPSVVGPAQDGAFEHVVVTPRNDVVAVGYSRTGFDEIILARFAPDGTERWAERRRGRPVEASGSPAVGLGLAVDPRGNLFSLSQTIEGGVYPHQTLGVDVAKHVQNGPAGISYCSPAPMNSTGNPATIRALGTSQASADNITLRADDMPPGALTLLLASRLQGSVPNVGGGQGRLCLSGEIGRFFSPGQVRVAGADGSAALQIYLNDLPQPMGSVAATAGESWNFQAWYRDANPNQTSNLTDGVAVLLQ